MRTHSEVNFEKRGKLSDHVTCPVTGWCQCCCEHCKPSKRLFLLSVFFFLLFLPSLSLAANAPYDFKTVDIEITGRPDAVVWLRDINSKGWILASTFWTDNGQPVWGSLIGKLNKQLNKLSQVEIFFDCTGARINDRGAIIGQAADGACVRRPNGNVIVLTGVPQGVGFGISTDRVSGTYCVPNGPPNFGCTGHGFTWSPVEDYRTIDLVGAPGTNIRIAPIGPNNLGQLLLEYFADNGVETTEHGYCIFEAGSCGAPFVLSFEFVGGPAAFIADFNDSGQAIVQRYNTGPATLQLYDEGFLDIALPGGWLLSSLEGMSNEGAFVGAYQIQVGFDPFYGTPILERHDFIATPVLAQIAKK